MSKDQENWKESKDRRIKKVGIADVLCSIFDNLVDSISAFDSHKPYKVSAQAYFESQNYERSDIRQQLYYLKKRNLIKSVMKNNEHYFELTKKGQKVLIWDMIGKGRNKETKWDKNFRIVMFDIPEDKKSMRNVLRKKLEKIGFLQMQKSVFVYPYECKNDIDSICYFLGSAKYLKYLVVKITEGEEDLIEEFLSRNILTLDDLK